ncbi:MAG: hypothetical protein E3J35_06130 [Methanomassiliicoccales archaeon]|nr:MAG: hypothetical protein E3J35_06130 [Methanomassiliicoccales archaeon]
MRIGRGSSLAILFLLSSVFAGIPLDAGTIPEVMDGIAWGPEIELSSDLGADAQGSPSIAVEGNKIHVVWSEYGPGGGDSDIYYRHFDGTTWQPESKISTATAPRGQGHPSVIANGSRVHVVWEYTNRIFMEDPDYVVRYRMFDGTSWGSEQVISTKRKTVFWPTPVVAVDGDKVHVLWVVNGTGAIIPGGLIYYREFNGTSWGPETEFIPTFSRYPSIIAENGRIHVSWERYGEFDSHVFYKCFNGTDWQPRQNISAGLSNGNHNPSMAVEGDKVHFAWRYGFNGPFDIYYRYLNGTNWSSPEKVNVDPPWDPWFDGNPSIAVDGGDVHVAWESQEDGDIDINYRFFGGPVQRINMDTGTAWQTDPSVVAKDGRVHVVWKDRRDGDADIYYRSGVVDTSDPASSADPISPYWQTNSTLAVLWTATDDHGLANISLYSRFSPDNSSWSAWEEWGFIDTLSGNSSIGSFIFTAPYGEGFYEFYTIANDTAGNLEAAPSVADARFMLATASQPPSNLNANLTGMGLGDVTLSWALSPDDGAGKNDIARYDVYRGTTFDSSGSGYTYHSSVPAGSSIYVDNLAGEGNPSNCFYYVCSVNLFNLSSCNYTQAGKFTRPLSEGPTLVSIPLVQSNESVGTVLQTLKWNRAWAYDPTVPEWKSATRSKPYFGELQIVNHSMGLWVSFTEDSNLTVAGIVPSTTSIHLSAGWNLIGFPSFNSTYTVADLKSETGATRVEGYDTISPPYHLKALQGFEVLKAGEGYWVYVPSDVIWVLSNV